jgi:6-pyruvoyltetrahydropterin/6-carboxytetrahydropterin synthase
MYEIEVEGIFSAAHNLRHYKGKCENVHGHNWKVQIAVIGESLDDIGLLIDFDILKSELKKILKELDHQNLNSISFFKKINPTSENIAFYIHNKIKKALKKYPVEIKRVAVGESDKQSAAYYEQKI